MTDKTYHLIAKWRGGYCNLPVTKVEKEDSIVWAWYNGEFVGMFDLGAVELLYVTEEKHEAYII